MRRRRLVLGLVGVGALTLGACRPADQATRSLDVEGSQTRASLPDSLVAALDSGSAAYRAGDLDRALEHYRRATDMAPDQPAGWFGLFMVHERRGETDAAERALERARRAAPGATILRVAPGDTAGGAT